MSGYESILYEKERGRARITLNRPERLNALSLGLLTELSDAVWEADNDRDVHCVIVRGAGRAFSAGYDLAGGGNRPVPNSSIEDREANRYRGGGSVDDDIWQMERSQRLRMALFDAHKPSIAQVHGYCLAGGTDVALLCDMVVAADTATIGFPAGRAMGALPNNMWLYNVGPQWAKRLQLTGDSITGAEAQPGADGGDRNQLGDRPAMRGIRKRAVFYAHGPVAGPEGGCVVEFGESFVCGGDELFAGLIFCVPFRKGLGYSHHGMHGIKQLDDTPGLYIRANF